MPLPQDLGPSVPLVIKVGAYPDQEALRHVLTAAARAGAAAVAGERLTGGAKYLLRHSRYRL